MATPQETASEISLTEAEAAHLAARETIALDLSQPAGPVRRPSDRVADLPTVVIPRQRPDRPGGKRGAPLLVAALVSTGWAALSLLVPLLLVAALVRAAEGPVAWSLSLRFVLAGWLLSHGVPLTVPLNGYLGTMGLAPLALTAFAMWRVSRAGVHTTRAVGGRGTGSLRHTAIVALSVGAVYGVFGLAAAVFVNGPGIFVAPWRAGAHFAVLGLVGAGAGSIRATGALRRIARATPMVLRDGVRAGMVAVLLILASGAGAVGLSVAMNGGRAAQHFAGFPAGLLGEAALTLVSLAFAPNFAAWAASYLLGPGFAAGTLALTELPVVAGIPAGPLRGLGWLLMVLPLLGGVAASALMTRRRLRPRRSRLGDVYLPRPRWWKLCGAAALAGPVAGGLLGVLALVSGGALPAGGGEVVRTGPVAWQVALVATMVVTLGALVGVAGTWVARWGALGALLGAARTWLGRLVGQRRRGPAA